jgi:hypothetical protein
MIGSETQHDCCNARPAEPVDVALEPFLPARRHSGSLDELKNPVKPVDAPRTKFCSDKTPETSRRTA